jgi:hypothetical protein
VGGSRLSNLIVKQVNFEDVNMIACKTPEDEILVGIRSICEGLGVFYSSQMKRIERDDVLPEGVVKMTIPTNQGNQESNMLKIDYLPFFLTGIKVSMCKEEIRPRLREFKVKVKDTLSNAFIKNPKDNNMKVISLLHAEVGELIAATNQIESRVENLENNMTIDYAQQLILQDIAKAAAINAMGGKDNTAYKNCSLRSKVFSQVWKDYKEYFEINSYKNTARVEFDKAKEYLRNWKAQGKILREIDNLNCQIGFES